MKKDFKIPCLCAGGKSCDKLWILDVGDGQVEINILVAFPIEKKPKKIGKRYIAGGVVVDKEEFIKLLK